MRFMVFYRPETDNGVCAAPTPEGMAAMGAFIHELSAAGILLATEGLHPAAQGARVRRSQGTVTVSDGPYAETKEQIGGFAIIQVDSKDQAIEVAGRFLQVAGDGETEIRLLVEPEDFGPAPTGEPELAGARR